MRRAVQVLTACLLLSPSARSEESSCTDTWPEDRKRPQFTEHFPTRGVSGHVSVLELKIEHLPGETVFPGGLKFDSSSEQAKWLDQAEFRMPHSSSLTQPRISASATESAQGKGKNTNTTVHIPLIPLPREAGRKELTLPRLPVAVARSSGQVHTICTQPHVITVEDPLASSAETQAKPDPEPRPQIEVWEALRDAVIALLVALPLAAVLAWLFFRFRNSFKKAPKPPPPRPPWETALRKLDELEARRLLEKQDYEEYLDVVSDTLREYLGQRYGFDGLESTTRETLRQLTQLAPDFEDERTVRTVLQRADLVKFARRLPSDEECQEAMSETRRLIRLTVPAPSLDPRPSSPRSSGPPSPGRPLSKSRPHAPGKGEEGDRG